MADDPTEPTDAPEAPEVDDAPEVDETGAEPNAVAPAKAGEVKLTKPVSAAAAAKESGSSTAGAKDDAKPVVRKKVVSKRVTPKGGPVKGATKGSTANHAHSPDGHDAPGSTRYTPPSAKYADMPSPMWVPVLMFALLGIGAVVIVGNYARLFGDPSNVYLVAGLGCILGGIITATNYR